MGPRSDNKHDMKGLNVVSWHFTSPERRLLKRNRLGPPDVYPQDVKQEEDNLGADRLKKGYQVAVTSYEHESIVWNAKVPRLDRLDDTMLRGAQVVMQVMAKKMEINANLDKERKRGTKDCSTNSSSVFQNFPHNMEKAGKSKERKEWFTDLAYGKSLLALSRRPPIFRKKEDALEYLCDYKVSVARALWFLKLTAVSQGLAPNVNKQKKSTNDQLPSEHACLFTKYVKLMLCQMSDSAKLESNIVYTERWPHFVCICKHAYEDGMIEKQEFLMDLCDIFSERFVHRYEKGQHNHNYVSLFRMFLSFFCQYTDQITKNLLLSRRVAFLVCKRLKMYKEEAEETARRKLDAGEVFEDMVQCVHQRAIILSLCGLLCAVVIDCPGALIWNNFKVADGRPPALLHQLCGSPLDHLPCRIQSLPMPSPGSGCERLQDFIQQRISEVKRRSRAVENRWSLNQTHNAGFAATMLACLKIVGVLDSVLCDRPNAIEKMYSTIFNGSSRETFEHEHAIRVKMLLQWAVTVEREGTHRAVIVASLLAFRVNHRKTFRFGNQTLQDILLEYLTTEGPEPGQPHFHDEFANLMLLFMELQRAGIFSHDAYVKELITTGVMSDIVPLMANLKKNAPLTNGTDNGVHTSGQTLPSSSASNEPKDIRSPTTIFATLPTDSPDAHPLMGGSLNMHERFLIHLPIPQIPPYRSECNQRALLLYGNAEQRDIVKNELKKVARDLNKIWTKRLVIEFSFSKPQEIRFKKRTTKEQINETMNKFRSQTYHDQVVLCGWCCESFVSMLIDFVEGHCTVLPAAEGFDLLLEMCENAKNICGIMELAEEVLPLLVQIEAVLTARRVDCVPSLISAQLAYILTAYIAHNYYYFLHAENATDIVSGLYRVIESQLKSGDGCLTGWGRTVAVFVLDAKKDLIETGLATKKIDGKRELLRRVVPPWKPSHAVETKNQCSYNANTFRELLDEPKRIFSFNEYRRLHTLIDSTEDARYSFVVGALLAVVKCGNDYDRLAELANICGHMTAQAAQSEKSLDWCGALQALCCSSLAGSNTSSCYPDILMSISVEDSTCHYNLALFYMLLAGRSCFSMNSLVHQLLHTALKSLLNSGQGKGLDADAEAGACLALLVLCDIICQSDAPIILSKSYAGDRGGGRASSVSGGFADRWILSEGHLHDIGDEVCNLLVTICMIADYTKNKLRDRFDDKFASSIASGGFSREYISELSRMVLLAMCEQDWVTQRIYKRCEDATLDCFSSHQLRKNCLGQQLLRMALRRRCERGILRELTICNGNSKKSLIDKLLSVLNIWNIRATYFDLKLMIKEISPEGSSNKHAQQGAIAADALIGEIGKCCRDLFTSANKLNKKLPEAATGKAFRLRHISAYWLISPLVYACPRPGNLPASFPAVTVQAKFLKEAAQMLDTATDCSKERIQQSAWLLSQEPFLNLVLTCLRGEEQQRDGLVGSLLKQLQDLTNKAKENPLLPYLRKFSLEREGLLLRLSLVGGMFDSVCHPSSCDAWALLLFQLMLYGIVSRERDRYLFDSCYDMLSTLLVWSITDPMNAAPVNLQDPETKYRFANYSVIIKKLRKEMNERTLIPELRSLMQFLPIPKRSFELLTCEPYGTVPASPTKLSKNQSQSQVLTVVKANRQGLQFGEKTKLSAYDLTQNFNTEPSAKRTWTWSMFQAVKLDRLPTPVQRQILRLIHHSHYNEFVRPTICGMDRPPNLDIYLSPPVMDVSESQSVTLHHCNSSTATNTTTSASNSTNVSAASVSTSSSMTIGLEMQQAVSGAPPPGTPSGSLPSVGPQSAGGSGLMFTGQGGPMPTALPQEMTNIGRGQANSSPKGSRGGRRKATGLSTRAQGTTRKQRQQRQAAAAAVEQQLAGVAAQQHDPTTVMSAPTGMGPPAQGSSYGSSWQVPSMQQQGQVQQYSAPNPQAAGINQGEDSKMKIHSMILQKRQQAQQASSTQQSSGGVQDCNAYGQTMGGSTSGQYGQMVMKIEGNAAMQMEHQQCYSTGQLPMPNTEQQTAQYGNTQHRNVYGQQGQPSFDSRMLTHQGQAMQYSQQQYQQQY